MPGKIEMSYGRVSAMAAELTDVSAELKSARQSLYTKNYAVLQDWTGDAADGFRQAAYSCEMELQKAAIKIAAAGKMMKEAAEERKKINEEALNAAGKKEGTRERICK